MKTGSDLHAPMLLAMPQSHHSSTSVDVHALTEETLKLLSMSLDALHMTLGGQLLGTKAPSTVAGIVSYLTATRSASDASALYRKLPIAFSAEDLSKGLGIICEELKSEGIQYISEKGQELREALNNEDLLRLSEGGNRPQVQVIFMVVAAVLRLPRELDTIAATVTAVLLKGGLREFCERENKTQS